MTTAGRDAEPVDEPAPVSRPDWRDTLRAAADLALLGIVTTIAAIPIVTTGAALATASTAIHRWTVDGSWPSLGDLLRGFWRALLPGAVATLAGLAAFALLGGNLVLISAGVVPGGAVMLVGTLLLIAVTAGLAGTVVVQVGRQDGTGWRAATLTAWGFAQHRPLVVLAAAGVVSLAALLAGLAMPLLAPILLGYTLFGLHTALRRLASG
ncbi:hypothetical protein O7632_30205 [Solwaraspora sp. WMMD406]|uniref:hypothetical protein n=1 Tax=Solwaraspora sp. WMMD406 TaxID=3016095 RepID=UPI002415EB08|nr:hypothetical protein [Solwaraspora sp. WMMD406]MDG4768332.1 hypothetical protein [Solwaraspora sp. WMMD406]